MRPGSLSRSRSLEYWARWSLGRAVRGSFQASFLPDVLLIHQKRKQKTPSDKRESPSPSKTRANSVTAQSQHRLSYPRCGTPAPESLESAAAKRGCRGRSRLADTSRSLTPSSSTRRAQASPRSAPFLPQPGRGLKRSREMTRLCSRGMDHRRYRRRGRAWANGQEAPVSRLPSVVLARPSGRHSAAGVFGAVVPGGTTGADAGFVAAA
jgi:hypothetical protein